MKVQRFHNIISITMLHHSYQNLWGSSEQEIGIWEFQTTNLTTSYWNFLLFAIYNHRLNINQITSYRNLEFFLNYQSIVRSSDHNQII